MRQQPLNIDMIAHLPIEERHAIVVAWLNTLASFYEQAATRRDRYQAALDAILAGADGIATCRAALEQEE